MFYRFQSEYVNKRVGNLQLQYPNDSFYFVGIAIIFVSNAIMIIVLSSTSSLFLPLLVILLSISFMSLGLLFLMHTAKDWVHLLFGTVDAILVIEDIVRRKYSTRMPGGRRKACVVDDDDEIGDIEAPAKKEKTLRISMDRLDKALKQNIFT